MKKILFLSFLLIFTNILNVNAKTWCGYNWNQNCFFVEASNILKENEVIEDKDWNLENLDRPITRKEFFTYISKASWYSSEGQCSWEIFKDVNISTVWEETCGRIEQAAAMWLTSTLNADGSKREYFEINKNLPRKEYASFIIKFQGYTNEDLEEYKNPTMYFPDIWKSDFHIKSINLSKKLWIFGWNNWKFLPDNDTSIWEAFATLSRLFK